MADSKSKHQKLKLVTNLFCRDKFQKIAIRNHKVRSPIRFALDTFETAVCYFEELVSVFFICNLELVIWIFPKFIFEIQEATWRRDTLFFFY